MTKDDYISPYDSSDSGTIIDRLIDDYVIDVIMMKMIMMNLKQSSTMQLSNLIIVFFKMMILIMQKNLIT
jgi:hypothetical protein